MAVVKCPKSWADVWYDAPRRPHCGDPIAEKRKTEASNARVSGFLFFIELAAAFLFWSTSH